MRSWAALPSRAPADRRMAGSPTGGRSFRHRLEFVAVPRGTGRARPARIVAPRIERWLLAALLLGGCASENAEPTPCAETTANGTIECVGSECECRDEAGYLTGTVSLEADTCESAELITAASRCELERREDDRTPAPIDVRLLAIGQYLGTARTTVWRDGMEVRSFNDERTTLSIQRRDGGLVLGSDACTVPLHPRDGSDTEFTIWPARCERDGFSLDVAAGFLRLDQGALAGAYHGFARDGSATRLEFETNIEAARP